MYPCMYARMNVCTSDQPDVVGSTAHVGSAALLFNFYSVESD